MEILESEYYKPIIVKGNPSIQKLNSSEEKKDSVKNYHKRDLIKNNMEFAPAIQKRYSS